MPCASVVLHASHDVGHDDINDVCRRHLAGFKAPKSVVFHHLPKPATVIIGKLLRRKAARNGSPRLTLARACAVFQRTDHDD